MKSLEIQKLTQVHTMEFNLLHLEVKAKIDKAKQERNLEIEINLIRDKFLIPI